MKGYTLIEVLVLIGIAAVIIAWVVAICIGFHFIIKFW